MRRTCSSDCRLVKGVFWDVLTYLLKHLVTSLSYQDRTHYPVTNYTKQINAGTELVRETGAWDKQKPGHVVHKAALWEWSIF